MRNEDYVSIIAPSILASDFSCLEREIKSLEQTSADWIHCDVMDGHFVPNISFGLPVITSIKKKTILPLDIHLMIQYPHQYVHQFLPFADSITIHAESSSDNMQVLRQIKDSGKKAGIAIKPKTSLLSIQSYLYFCDILLIMTVEPGFGGQMFLYDMVEKIDEANKFRSSKNLSFLIEVDGGINKDTAVTCHQAGSNIFVVGTAFFQSNNRVQDIEFMKYRKK